MSNTYSTAPFIAFDAPDEHGVRAEVRVVTGYGRIADTELSKAGKSHKVSFSVDNSKFQPSGWSPDPSVMAKVEESERTGEPLHFRIETRRQKQVDRTLPMSEVAPKGDTTAARDNIHKSLAAVKFEEDENWTIAAQAVTNMAEDRRPNANGIYSAKDMSPEELAKLSPSNNGGGNGGGGAYQGSHSLESTPFYSRNRDGGVNPGSVAVSVPLTLLEFVAEWDRNHEELDRAGIKKQRAVAKAMLAAANELQVAIYDGKLDAPDLSLGSHTRARQIVFNIVRNYTPINNEVVESKETLVAWKEQIVEKGTAMWEWSIKEAEAFISED